MKYPDSNWERIYQLCKGVFAALPLCAIIEDRVYVAHGGKWSHVSIHVSLENVGLRILSRSF